MLLVILSLAVYLGSCVLNYSFFHVLLLPPDDVRDVKENQSFFIFFVVLGPIASVWVIKKKIEYFFLKRKLRKMAYEMLAQMNIEAEK